MNDCFTCPLCSRVSYGTEDVRHQYCPCCGGPDLPKRCDHTLRAAIDRVQVTFTRLEAQQREHAKAAGIYAQAQMARATAKTDYDAACRELLNLAQAAVLMLAIAATGVLLHLALYALRQAGL